MLFMSVHGNPTSPISWTKASRHRIGVSSWAMKIRVAKSLTEHSLVEDKCDVFSVAVVFQPWRQTIFKITRYAAQNYIHWYYVVENMFKPIWYQDLKAVLHLCCRRALSSGHFRTLFARINALILIRSCKPCQVAWYPIEVPISVDAIPYSPDFQLFTTKHGSSSFKDWKYDQTQSTCMMIYGNASWRWNLWWSPNGFRKAGSATIFFLHKDHLGNRTMPEHWRNHPIRCSVRQPCFSSIDAFSTKRDAFCHSWAAPCMDVRSITRSVTSYNDWRPSM